LLMFAVLGRGRRLRVAAPSWQRAVSEAFTDQYRPEQHYMRDRGPVWLK
jgi:hypothetical protein